MLVGRPAGRPASRFHAEYNAAAQPKLIIWDDDQMIWDGQLGPSVGLLIKPNNFAYDVIVKSFFQTIPVGGW